MDDALKAIGEKIGAALPGAITGVHDAFGELTLVAEAARIIEVLTFLRDEANDALCCLFGDNGWQVSVGFSFFVNFAPVAATQFTGFEHRLKSGGSAEGTQFEMILAELRQVAPPTVQREDIILP